MFHCIGLHHSRAIIMRLSHMLRVKVITKREAMTNVTNEIYVPVLLQLQTT